MTGAYETARIHRGNGGHPRAELCLASLRADQPQAARRKRLAIFHPSEPALASNGRYKAYFDELKRLGSHFVVRGSLRKTVFWSADWPRWFLSKGVYSMR